MSHLPYFFWEEALPYITTDPKSQYRTVCHAWRTIFNRNQEVRLCVDEKDRFLGDATTLEASGAKLFQHPQLLPLLPQLRKLKLKLQGESSIDYIELVQVLKNLTRLRQLDLDFSGCRYRLSPLLASTNRVSELSLILLDFEPERVQDALDGLNHPRLTSLSLTIPTLNQNCLNHLISRLPGLRNLSILWKDNASGTPVQIEIPAKSQLQQLTLERFYASESRSAVITLGSLSILSSFSCRAPFKIRTHLTMPNLHRLSMLATVLSQNRPLQTIFPNLIRLDVNCRKVDSNLIDLLVNLPNLRRLRLSQLNDPKILLSLLPRHLPITHFGLSCPRGYTQELMDILPQLFPDLFYLQLESYLPLPTISPPTSLASASTSASTTSSAPASSSSSSSSSITSIPSPTTFTKLTVLYLSLDRATVPTDLVQFLYRSPNLDRLLLSGNVDLQVLDQVRQYTPKVRIEPMAFLAGSCQSRDYMTAMF